MMNRRISTVVFCVFMILAMNSCVIEIDKFEDDARDVSMYETVSVSSVSDIKIDTTVANVTIGSAKRSDISVEVSGRSSADSLGFSVSKENGTVIIKCRPDSKSWNSLYLDITIPEMFEAEDIYVSSSVGRIQAEDITVSGGIYLKNATGGINSSAVRSHTFDAESVTGPISLENLEAEILTAESETGSVLVDCAAQPSEIDISTTTSMSELLLPGNSSFHLVAKTGTGRVNCSGFNIYTESSGKNKLSGTVIGRSEKMSEIWIDSSTGNITVKSR